MIQRELCRTVPHDKDSLAVPIARDVSEEIADALAAIPQAFTFGKWRINADRALGVDLLHRCFSHRPVVVLAKALVRMDGDALAERDLCGLDGAPEVLLDPNKFSADGTSQLGGFSLSESGKYVAYGISEGGSDWRDFYVLDVGTRKALTDHLEWVKFSGASWIGDQGFFYNRYPRPESGKKMAGKNDYQKTYYHKVGTPQSEDNLSLRSNQ